MNHLHATFLVLTLFWLPAAHAGNVVLEHDAEFIPLGQEVHYLEDVQGTLSFEAAKNTYTQGLFTQSSMDTPAFGFTTSTYWFAVDISSNARAESSWLLQIAYPPLDLVEVQIFSNNDLVNHYKTGDRLSLSHKPIANRNYLFPVSVKPNASSLIMIRVQQLEGDVVEVPMALISQETFAESEMLPLLMDGAYTGIMLVMALYNLLLFFYLKQRAYLFYVGYVAFSALFFVGLNGWPGYLIWPNNTWLNQIIFPFCITSVSLFLSEFTISLINIHGKVLRFLRYAQLGM
ncbi:MAG: hypothetical protein HOK41_12345, partial [Nitrospina sp.]|nr:hypothetical protein [Nitrospina sp.]